MSDTPGATDVPVEKVGGAIVARPRVKLMDEATFNAMTRSIEDAGGNDPGVSLVVLDLSGVTIMPSLALGRLMMMANACRERGQTIKLAGLQPQIRRVFAVTKLDTMFEIVDSVQAAIG